MKKEKGMVLIYRRRLGARGTVIFIYLLISWNLSRADCIDRAKLDVD